MAEGKDTMNGKTVVITGANSGIGKAAAVQMAELGANVVMACRSLERSAAALAEVKQSTGNEQVEFLHLDLF